MLISLKDFKKEGKKFEKRVKDMLLNGKNIYASIKGHENEINYELYDLPLKKTGFENLVVSLTILYPGKVGKEFKMTTGHKHDKEEVYFFLDGNGLLLLDKKKFKVRKNCIALVKKNVWHRVINTGKKKLIFLSVFEKYGGRGGA
jgi:glucose-6-phosphate isomerase